MDVHNSNRDVATPLSFKSISFSKTEDSGYHTSYTSPSLECSAISNESSLMLPNYCKIQVECYPITPSPDVRSKLKCHCSNKPSSSEVTPFSKRSLKRPYEEDSSLNEFSTFGVATPTSIIANEVQKLQVNDNKINSTISSCDSGQFESIISEIYYKEFIGSTFSHPSTPIKKVCRTSCNLSPFSRRRSSRKVDFTIHSLSCEKQISQPHTDIKQKESNIKTFKYKPNQKIDIIKMLYSHEDYCSTSIRKILSYLSQEDIYNFTLVSPMWCSVFKSTSTKNNCNDFFKSVKSNIENWDHGDTLKVCGNNQFKPFKEIQNANLGQSTPRSPIRSPRSTKFNKFIVAASQDSRSQLSCIKCRNPAKVTVEVSGEEWVECTSRTCSHQFCKFCKSTRHPGKSCMQYDIIDGPSPSKRKKNVCPVSSNKSKKKLKRLLF